jgi:hypothetical protein
MPTTFADHGFYSYYTYNFIIRFQAKAGYPNSVLLVKYIICSPMPTICANHVFSISSIYCLLYLLTLLYLYLITSYKEV